MTIHLEDRGTGHELLLMNTSLHYKMRELCSPPACVLGLCYAHPLKAFATTTMMKVHTHTR